VARFVVVVAVAAVWVDCLVVRSVVVIRVAAASVVCWVVKAVLQAVLVDWPAVWAVCLAVSNKLVQPLGGGAQAGQQQAPQQPQQGGFGDLFNNALAGQEPQPDPAAEQQAEVMLRAMLMAARADGQIDAAEQEKITGNLGEIGEEEAAFIRNEMANPTSLEAFVPTIPSGMEQQVYLMSLLAIDLDTQEEAQYLDKLAKALNIDHSTSNAIHAKLGVPALYG